MAVDGMFFSKVLALAGKHFEVGKAPVSIAQAEQIRTACEMIQDAMREAKAEHEAKKETGK